MATTTTAVSLRQHFADLINPRVERGRRHEPLDILGIAIGAVVCGADPWPAVAEYGRAKQDWLAPWSR
jgi:DDE_Tnp_1-associated